MGYLAGICSLQAFKYIEQRKLFVLQPNNSKIFYNYEPLLKLFIQGEDEPIIPRFNPFVFLLPAICDIISTCVLYVGLNLTTASSYQMLQGTSLLIACTVKYGSLLLNAQTKIRRMSATIRKNCVDI